ncbi:MAG: YbjQ family protein [Thaumarchaeota archaeon]|nr:MAG: YbjQ family protein [Nitrososphaerota archaeon]
MEKVLLTTTPSVPGHRIKEVLGIVHGMTARTRGVGGKFLASIQSAFGGEVSTFTRELEKAKQEALDRMVQEAVKLGADAIIGIDFETTEVFESVVLVSAHGTAVKVEPEDKP